MKKKKRAPPKRPQATVVHLDTVDGKKKILIPVGARMTFGPAVPSRARKEGAPTLASSPAYRPPGQRAMEYALRVYKGNDYKQIIAVFTGVYEFHVDGIEVATLISAPKSGQSGKECWEGEEGFTLEQANVQSADQWGVK